MCLAALHDLAFSAYLLAEAFYTVALLEQGVLRKKTKASIYMDLLNSTI